MIGRRLSQAEAKKLLAKFPLDGDNTVHLAHMDEAGISKQSQEPFLVVAGVIVDGDKHLNGVENQLERIMVRQIPERLRDRFVFHAMEVFNGGKTLKREKDDLIGPHEWPLERRLAIADEIMDVPRKFKLPIAISFVERANFRPEFQWPAGFPESEITVAQHVAAFMNCAMFVEHWMRKEATDKNCMLIVENTGRANKLIRDVQQYHQDRRIEALLDEVGRQHFPFRKIKKTPVFEPKMPSSPLILADFCAYVFKKYLMKDARYKRFIEPIKDYLISFDEAWLARRRGRDNRSIRGPRGGTAR